MNYDSRVHNKPSYRPVTATTEPNKPLKYSKDSLTQALIGKSAKIQLVNTQMVEGILLDIGMYDIRILTKEATLILMKSGILTVQVIS